MEPLEGLSEQGIVELSRALKASLQGVFVRRNDPQGHFADKGRVVARLRSDRLLVFNVLCDDGKRGTSHR